MKKLLCHSDFSLAGTGFGTVSRYILTTLHATGRYDIHHLAINFHGDFVDPAQVPWQVQPSRLLDPKDPHGIKMLVRTILRGAYDIVWIMNDIFVTAKMVPLLIEAKKQLAAAGKPIPKFIYYYPVDRSVPAEWASMIRFADVPVCYTDHGREETLKSVPEVREKLRQIPHGVDNTIYHPVSVEQIHKWKRQLFHTDPDTYIVLNINRNSARKQLPYSIACFREFKKKVPKSMMYIHAMARDQGGDLVKVIRELGLDPSRDVIFPTKLSPSNPAPVETLNAFYNCADLFISTSLGEGYGETHADSLAVGTPVVIGDHTCTRQLFGERGERGYIYPCKDLIWIDQSGHRPKGLIPDIVKEMMKAYHAGPKQENKKVLAGLEWARENDWSIINQRWVELFREVEDMPVPTEVNTEII